MMYSKLGHKLTNVKTARINKVVIALFCLWNCTVQTSIFSKRLPQNLSSPIVPELDYIVQYFMLFPMMYNKLGHKLTNVKTARINKVEIAFVYGITLRKHLYSVSVRARSVLLIVLKLNYIVQNISCSF